MSKAMRIFSILISIVVVIFGLSFAIENQEKQVIYVLGTEFKDIPLSMALVLALGLGVIIGGLASLAVVLRYKHINNKLNRALKRYESHPGNTSSDSDRDNQ
jgi:uncharacterized integral membrane protein